jgi:bacteriocin-like protein
MKRTPKNSNSAPEKEGSITKKNDELQEDERDITEEMSKEELKRVSGGYIGETEKNIRRASTLK